MHRLRALRLARDTEKESADRKPKVTQSSNTLTQLPPFCATAKERITDLKIKPDPSPTDCHCLPELS